MRPTVRVVLRRRRTLRSRLLPRPRRRQRSSRKPPRGRLKSSRSTRSRRKTPRSKRPRPPRLKPRWPTRRPTPTRMPTSPSDMTDEPAIDSAGGFVRLRLDIAYDGTEFAGWAVQAGQRTVAGVLDDALSTVFRVPVRLRAAGRTDAGVHANGQVAHVDVPSEALAHAYPRTGRPDPEFGPLV